MTLQKWMTMGSLLVVASLSTSFFRTQVKPQSTQLSLQQAEVPMGPLQEDPLSKEQCLQIAKRLEDKSVYSYNIPKLDLTEVRICSNNCGGKDFSSALNSIAQNTDSNAIRTLLDHLNFQQCSQFASLPGRTSEEKTEDQKNEKPKDARVRQFKKALEDVKDNCGEISASSGDNLTALTCLTAGLVEALKQDKEFINRPEHSNLRPKLRENEKAISDLIAKFNRETKLLAGLNRELLHAPRLGSNAEDDLGLFGELSADSSNFEELWGLVEQLIGANDKNKSALNLARAAEKLKVRVLATHDARTQQMQRQVEILNSKLTNCDNSKDECGLVVSELNYKLSQFRSFERLATSSFQAAFESNSMGGFGPMTYKAALANLQNENPGLHSAILRTSQNLQQTDLLANPNLFDPYMNTYRDEVMSMGPGFLRVRNRGGDTASILSRWYEDSVFVPQGFRRVTPPAHFGSSDLVERTLVPEGGFSEIGRRLGHQSFGDLLGSSRMAFAGTQFDFQVNRDWDNEDGFFRNTTLPALTNFESNNLGPRRENTVGPTGRITEDGNLRRTRRE